jgi:hypothetical protein
MEKPERRMVGRGMDRRILFIKLVSINRVGIHLKTKPKTNPTCGYRGLKIDRRLCVQIKIKGKQQRITGFSLSLQTH